VTALLTLDRVTAGYGPYKALHDLSLVVEAGASVAIVGRNGAGKSTVARVASGLVPLTSGTGSAVSRDLTRTTTASLARAGLVHVPEGVGLFRALSVEENITLRLGRQTSAVRRDRLAWALEHLGDLAQRRQSPAGEFSGGQQRRIAVVAALAAQPTLLIVDEPSMGLSPAAATLVHDDLALARTQGCTLVIIESTLDLVGDLCPRTVVMDRGRVTYDGTADGAAVALRQQFQAPSPDGPV
jgi:branched-chain amino acid transport system ATP-binding protein